MPNFKLNQRLMHLSALLADFSAAPFRLFFLTACLVAIAAALVWSVAILGGHWLITDPLTLHIFLFLQGLSGVVYAGFLFTAIPEWTHNPRDLSRFMQGLWLLWLLAVMMVMVSLKLALLMMSFYWFFVWLLATLLVWEKRDDRQISVLLFVAATWLITLWLMVKAWGDEVTSFDWQQLLHIEMMGVALITFRISKALGTQALEDGGQHDSLFVPNPFYKNLAVWLFYSLVVVNIILHNQEIEGWLSLAISGVMIGRLREWHFWILLKRHYVRWLYATLLLIGVGYAWRGLALIGLNSSPVLPLHLIALGGLLLMIYQVFNIAGLRHSGCDLIYPWPTRLGLYAVLMAALSRSVVAGLVENGYEWLAIYLPGALIVVAFAIYAVVFYQIFMRHPAVSPESS